MHFLFTTFFFIQLASAGTLSSEWVTEGQRQDVSSEITDSFTTILQTQAAALDSMEEGNKNFKAIPFGFELKELITDFAVSKSGLFGLSAMKSNQGLQVKWKKVSSQQNLTQEEEGAADITLEGEASPQDIQSLSDSIAKMAEASGKVRPSHQLRANVQSALESVNEQVKAIEANSYKRWKATGLRLDLLFSASGQVWFIARAGASLRLRLEWKLKEKPLMKAQTALVNPQTQFVVKTLAELDEALTKVVIKGYSPQKINIGVGASVKRKFFGLWKYSTGFMGFIVFIPKTVRFKHSEVELPAELLTSDFELGGVEEEASNQKGLWPWRRRKIPRASFQEGMTKSLQTAAFFAERSLVVASKHWQVEHIRTINDISQTGFFGLADVSAKGVVEIDFKRERK